jgi:hypothetical protein
MFEALGNKVAAFFPTIPYYNVFSIPVGVRSLSEIYIIGISIFLVTLLLND